MRQVALVLSSAVRVKCFHTADIVADRKLGKKMHLLRGKEIDKQNVNTAGQDSTYESEALKAQCTELVCMPCHQRHHI